ncbi:MAG: N-acetyl-gamma-glutamyl-phosphate reductase [Bryobacterales bacterium]|nr:N-acetyl-gamma-glutamyl-phosphate reductase [Bryobacterales bacterium]
MKTPVGIVGFRGYGGQELVRILNRHSRVEIVLLDHRSDSEQRPMPRNHDGPRRAAFSAEEVHRSGLAVVFLATPHEVAMEVAPGLLHAGAKVVDLSAAFRLREAAVHERWYKDAHTSVGLLSEAAYGLPEFYREKIRPARLVANPGCYPTAANLAIAPLVEAGLVDLAAGIVCDAKSGVSGAGRKPSLKTSYCEANENFSAYSLLMHRHVPEVLQNSGIEESQFSFTAHLLPLNRGILETIYFRAKGVKSAAEIVELYEKRYAGEPFVRVFEPGKAPDLMHVQHTNFCDLGVTLDAATGRGVVVSAIDNLVKGAAGQAVQNMNLILGYPETEALL